MKFFTTLALALLLAVDLAAPFALLLLRVRRWVVFAWIGVAASGLAVALALVKVLRGAARDTPSAIGEEGPDLDAIRDADSGFAAAGPDVRVVPSNPINFGDDFADLFE